MFFVQKGNQPHLDSKALRPYVQQQTECPVSSVATPHTLQKYPTPSTAAQQNKLGIYTIHNGIVIVVFYVHTNMYTMA